MTKSKPKKKLVASFKGPEAQAFEDDRVELTGKYHKSKGTYELYMTIQERV
jgi:hypothetical protein